MAEPEYLQVRNWLRFQNKDVFTKADGRPPWIKLKVELLEKPDSPVHSLSDADFGMLAKIWLLAAQTGNKIRNDPAWVRARIGARRPVPLSRYVTATWLEPWQHPADYDIETPANPHNDSRTIHDSGENQARLDLEGEKKEKDLLEGKTKGHSRAYRKLDVFIRNAGHQLTDHSLLDEIHAAGINGNDEHQLLELAHHLRHEQDPDHDIPLT